jgi:hypothetical protein
MLGQPGWTRPILPRIPQLTIGASREGHLGVANLTREGLNLVRMRPARFWSSAAFAGSQ